jgi:hypothetical protein
MDDLRRYVKDLVVGAISDPENYNDNGNINWDFVASDVYAAYNPANKRNEELLNMLFNELVEEIEPEENFIARFAFKGEK